MTEKNQDAVRLGRAGGLARTKNQGKEGLSRIGKIGAAARWAQHNVETKSDIIKGESDRK